MVAISDTQAYRKYLEMPKATLHIKDSEMYNKQWCVLTGRALAYPHPHRHYSFDEFVQKCVTDNEFRMRFLS